MTTRLFKEARELLPGLLGTCGLMASSWLILSPEVGSFFTVLAYAVGCVMLAGLSLGHELHHRTMPALLAQPVPRARIWLEKMLVLGVALAGVTLLMMAINPRVTPTGETSAGGSWPEFLLLPLCAFCGAPWLTLLTRNGIAGAVCSLACPAAIIGLAATVLSRFPQWRELEGVYITLLLIYCAVACVLSLRAFRTFQAVEGGGPALSLPDGFARFEGLRRRLVRGPFASLVWKEVRLQQVTFLVAALAAGIALIGLTLQQVWANAGELMIVANFFLYMTMLPFLAGALGVAEERSLGVTDWHLALPPSTAKQWLAKTGVVMGVSFLLGAVLPLGMLEAGTALFADKPLHRELPPDVATTLLAVQIFLTALALYASSLCRSTLKAIIVAFAMLAAVALCVHLAFRLTEPAQTTAQPGFAWAFSWATCGLAAVLLWLGYLNFRGRSPGAGMAQTAGILVLVTAVIAWLRT